MDVGSATFLIVEFREPCEKSTWLRTAKISLGLVSMFGPSRQECCKPKHGMESLTHVMRWSTLSLSKSPWCSTPQGSKVFLHIRCTSKSPPWLGFTSKMLLEHSGATVFLEGWFQAIGLDVFDISVGNSSLSTYYSIKITMLQCDCRSDPTYMK